MLYLVNLDLGGNQIINVRMQALASHPGSPYDGQYYWNTTDKKPYIYNATGTTWIDMSGGGNPTLGGDLSGTASAAVVDEVGGASAANIADAATKRHTQNTDTGTTSASFDIDSDGGASVGVKLKATSGDLKVRTLADDADADLTAKDGTFSGAVVITGDLTVNGTTTTLNTTTMETGDNEVVLNSEITTAGGNVSGGIAIKRLDVDNITRRDAKVQFNETSDRWEALYGVNTAAQTTRTIALKYATDVGDGAATQYTITHNLNTRDVTVEIFTNSGQFPTVGVDVERTGVDTVRLTFATAPASTAYRVVVTG